MKKHLSHLLLSIMLFVPATAYGAASFIISDTIAGIGTEASVQGLQPQEQVTLVVLPPIGPELTKTVNGNSKVHLDGTDTEVAGIYDAYLEKNGTEIASTSFEVLPESVDAQHSSMQSDANSIAPTGQDEAMVSVILRDRYGNPLSGRPVQLIAGRSSDTVNSHSGETDTNGEQTFSVTTTQPGTVTLRALDVLSNKLLSAQLSISAGTDTYAMGGYTAPVQQPQQQYYQMPYYAPMPAYYPPVQQQQQYYTVPTAATNSRYDGNNFIGQLLGRNLYGQAGAFDLVDNFEIRAAAEMRTNEDATIVIIARDRNGNKVEDYTGTALLSSTDEFAFLPLNGQITFQPQNLGEKVLTLGLRFRNPGEQMLYVEDSTDPNINGQAVITVTGEGIESNGQSIKITSHEQDGYVNSNDIVLAGTGPPFLNLVVTGGEKDFRGETDSSGNFTIDVKLNAAQADHTLRIRDETNRFDSGNLRLKFDETAPEIGNISFSPATPTKGEKVLLVVESEDALKSVTMKLADQEYTLEEQRSASGTYQVLFEPAESGTFQPIIVTTDGGGNQTEVRANLVVTPSSLSKVQNVVATATSNAVDLTWDAIKDDNVDAYRIYVGENKDDFLYTLDTDRPTLSATVAGLRPGKTYYFAITALKDERESSDKSDVATATVLGVELSVSPQDSALLLEWSSLESDLPLSSFLLEYGVEADSFTEQRNINGDLRAYTLRDLLNDVTYYVRLTPITTTGDVLRDLAVIGQGTPRNDAGGFHPSPSEKAPYDPNTVNPKPNYSNNAPKTPDTGNGVAGWWFAAALSLLAVGIHVRRRKTLNETAAFFQAMEQQYRQ